MGIKYVVATSDSDTSDFLFISETLRKPTAAVACGSKTDNLDTEFKNFPRTKTPNSRTNEKQFYHSKTVFLLPPPL